MVFRLLGEGVKWYHSKLKMNPLRTQLITGTLLTTSGDVICQLAVEKRGLSDDYDWIRSCRMGCFSMTVWVPVGYYWFGYAAKVSHNIFYRFTEISGVSWCRLEFGEKGRD